MMPHKLKRPIGFFLVVVGLVGIVLGSLGMYRIWQTRLGLETQLMAALTTAEETLSITQTALENANSALTTIDANIKNLNSTILTVAQGLNDAVPVAGNIADLLQEELPATLGATQTALQTAEASAGLLDGVMRAITSIPFYPGEVYNPEVPLQIAVKNVATSLENLPEALIEVGDQLEANQDNFADMEDDLIVLSRTLTNISTDIANAQTTLSEYQTLLVSVETQRGLLVAGLPGILDSVAWFLNILIAWLLFTQVGLILQGLTLADKNLAPTPAKTPTE